MIIVLVAGAIHAKHSSFFFFIQINMNAQNVAHPLAGESFTTRRRRQREKTIFSSGSDEENGR